MPHASHTRAHTQGIPGMYIYRPTYIHSVDTEKILGLRFTLYLPFFNHLESKICIFAQADIYALTVIYL